MGKRRHRNEGKHMVSRSIAKDMEAETASLPHYNAIAFRLPFLKLNVDSSPREKSQGNECPREMRALAASESALYDTRVKQCLQKRAVLSRRNCKELKTEDRVEGTSAVESPQSRLRNSVDAMGFLARELTEVKDALENNKTKLKRDKLKGLRKVIAGVMHTLRQDQLKTVLDTMDLSPNLKYENITQAASLSPRILNKAEKREPLNREIHVCKGCKEGGHHPWIYLYPDHEVYRTGGGFDCAEFLLPAVHSEKPLTQPKDPFNKDRGKLVDTSQHKLPDRLPAQLTKPVPFQFKREKQVTEPLFKIPRAEISPSVIRKVKLGERRPKTVPDLEEKKNSKDRNEAAGQLDRSGAVHSSLETITSSREKDSDFLNNTASSSSSNNTLILGWRRDKFSMETDSGVVTAASSSSESNSLENMNVNQKDSDRILQANALSSLQKRITGLKNLEPLPGVKQKTENELPKGPKKLVVRKSMALTTHVKGLQPFHNSTLLTKDTSASTAARNAFGARMKPLGLVQNRKKSKAADKGQHHESVGGSVYDMSTNFSTSLSLESASQKDSDNYSDFTLTGSQVAGTKRYLNDKRAERATRPKERKTSKASTRSVGKSEKLDSNKEGKTNKTEMGRKGSKFEPNKKETKEVFVDIISSMVSESTSPESLQAELFSKMSDCDEFSQSMSEGTTFFDATEDEVSDRLSLEYTNSVEDTNMRIGSDSFTLEGDDDFDEDDGKDLDGVDELAKIGGKVNERKARRKKKKRRTLQFRNEPLSKFALKRRRQEDFELFEEMENEDDLSMVDYAARYCIISLEKLSKYENAFTSYANCGGDAEEHGSENFGSDVTEESDDQKRILEDYEKLIYSMDIYQQKISENERKRTELNGERETVLNSITGLEIDEKKKKLLEKSIQAFSKKITTVDERIKTFVTNVKKLIEKKRYLEDKLRESTMDSAKVDKVIKNSDVLGRKFTKLKCLKIKVEDLPDALKSFNPNFDDEDFQFVNYVLKLPQKDSLDFKAFAVVSALTERVKSLDKSIKALLKDVDLGTLERKLDKCKELYRLLSEEHHDGQRTVPLENLLVELQAGGLDKDHQRSVVDKLNHHGDGFVDFLDFVLYIPLFLMIHDQIVRKPF